HRRRRRIETDAARRRLTFWIQRPRVARQLKALTGRRWIRWRDLVAEADQLKEAVLSGTEPWPPPALRDRPEFKRALPSAAKSMDPTSPIVAKQLPSFRKTVAEAVALSSEHASWQPEERRRFV